MLDASASSVVVQQILDHVGAVKPITKSTVVVASAHAGNHCNATAAVLLSRDALCLLHEQSADTLGDQHV